MTLLQYARAFDDMTPASESYDAVSFVDFLALESQSPNYAKPAGNPKQVGSKRRKAA